jgi:leucyl/phenylalanyl-tRNA--protein transferase
VNLLARQSPTFPPVDRALEDPNGLLAVGGALTTEWLTLAYQRGIFPWFDDDDGPILWWSPDPRAVLRPDRVRITRSLLKRLRNGGFIVTADTAFREVIAGCAAERAAPAGPGSFRRGLATGRELGTQPGGRSVRRVAGPDVFR